MSLALITRHASYVAWRPKEDLSEADWQDAGRQLGNIGRASPWWIGDWINYGAKRYGEKYAEALELTGYDVGTLMNLAMVAARYETSRRREDLSWSHHAEVASLEAAEADAWLTRAEKQNWSQKQLRSELKKAHSTPSTAEREPDDHHPLVRVVCECGGAEPDELRAAGEELCRHAAKRGFAVTLTLSD